MMKISGLRRTKKCKCKFTIALNTFFPPCTPGPSSISMLHTFMFASHNEIFIRKLSVAIYSFFHSYLRLSWLCAVLLSDWSLWHQESKHFVWMSCLFITTMSSTSHLLPDKDTKALYLTTGISRIAITRIRTDSYTFE